MKITRLTTYHAAPRWLFLKVETDEGVTLGTATTKADIITAILAHRVGAGQ